MGSVETYNEILAQRRPVGIRYGVCHWTCERLENKMKINLTKEVQNHDSILGHIVLQCMTDALMKHFMDRQSNNIISDVILTVDGHELDIEKFLKTWQCQIESIVLREAKKMADSVMNEKFNDVSDILEDLNGRLKEEVNKRLEEWEIDV